MVDALKRVRDWMAPGGVIIDIHPTATVAVIIIGDVVAGPIDPGGAAERHQAATDAIASAVAARLFTIEDALEFDFSTDADSLDELDEHINEDWREARIGERTLARARELVRDEPRARVRVRERVAAARLSI